MTERTIPPMPLGWNKTVADLMSELDRGLRQSVGSPECDWAIEYERSLLPADARYPRVGDVYVCRSDVAVEIMTVGRTPVTGGGRYTLPGGTRIRIDSAAGERPVAVYALPVDYRAVERAAIPFLTRIWPWYGGYCLAIDTRQLLTDFILEAAG
jgi:hypothetical protein